MKFYKQTNNWRVVKVRNGANTPTQSHHHISFRLTQTHSLPKCTRGVTASDQEFLREKVTVKVGCVCVWVCGRVLNEQEEEGFVNFISFVYFSFNKHTHTHAQTCENFAERVFQLRWEHSTLFVCVHVYTVHTVRFYSGAAWKARRRLLPLSLSSKDSVQCIC